MDPLFTYGCSTVSGAQLLFSSIHAFVKNKAASNVISLLCYTQAYVVSRARVVECMSGQDKHECIDRLAQQPSDRRCN